ncbi:DUF3302 domain-containing protein [Stenotrophomonas sp.]|uniref:DUF3302 domain-containing protein n=1 Tax=Stenotrophomonas sp. TaxID=69392 RepID=UPI0028A62268|nr:DUF3302 domain-containing protein [Stenotrophomonas sp.]
MNRPPFLPPRTARRLVLAVVATLCFASDAQASFLSGDALDTAANVIAWVALVVVPVALITVFWMVHILPEKIAEKRNHPQLEAIKTLCLLSLLFGGLLWPLAWLWAYTRPVLHKLAYGTDQGSHEHDNEALRPFHDARVEAEPAPIDTVPANDALWQQRVDTLERRLAAMEASRHEPPTGAKG